MGKYFFYFSKDPKCGHCIFAWFFPVHPIIISRRCPPSFVKIGQGFEFSWIFFKTLYFVKFQKFKTTLRWLGFPTKLCRPHSACICDTSQPRKLKNHDFENLMIHAHHQVTKSSQNTKIMHLAMHKPCQDLFLLLPNFSPITLEVFVRIESSQFSKTMIFVFHPTHHQWWKKAKHIPT